MYMYNMYIYSFYKLILTLLKTYIFGKNNIYIICIHFNKSTEKPREKILPFFFTNRKTF